MGYNRVRLETTITTPEALMAGFLHFLRCVGKAVVKNGVRALANLIPFGEVLFDIAKDTQEEYRKDHGEVALKADLEGLAQTSPPSCGMSPMLSSLRRLLTSPPMFARP